MHQHIYIALIQYDVPSLLNEMVTTKAVTTKPQMEHEKKGK
jgi:hypothetical protein